jgi:hypothetical protein
MPPRYAYWTILAGGLPTAFRAAEREDLLPTLKRIAATHPDAELKWFARGRLWSSPEEARDAPRASATGRGRDWRPGGDHRDPHQKFKDAKKARNAAQRQQRFDRKRDQAAPVKPDHAGRRPGPPAHGHTPGGPSAWAAGGGRKPGGRPPGTRPPGSRPSGSRPSGGRPSGSRPPGGRPPGGRPPGSRPPGSRPSGGRPPGSRPPGGRPKGRGGR